ncbi:nodulation-signaling pathway 1 protein [Carex littledalei]|uniref:Nodulation-signaling pathway 1 protein n=1 Tax=Carex littledalei TaxID=544730 RepID=A0A833QPU5_9POAL|nr:nodulation-signaling pathway 1 protein [Carex littledalei]
MNFEELEYNYTTAINSPQNHFSEWIEQDSISIEQDSISILPSFVDEITNYDWWDHDETFDHPPATIPAAPSPTSIKTPTLSPSSPSPHPELSKKRKENTNSSDTSRKASSGKKTTSKSAAGNPVKDARWAEQLLNPCVMAIETGNVSRAQHLIYVLQELASISGDINHRLSYHGLRILTRHLYSNSVATMVKLPPCESPIQSYVTAEAKLFRSTVIKFHEISPWFAIPNSLANSTIIKNLSRENSSSRVLHIVDLGVSHGVQWPTLLEALTHLPKGAPPLVRLTIANNVLPPVPFSVPPPGYNFPSHLIRYSKSINLNLQISQVESLMPQDLTLTPGEKLVICAQFRIGNYKDTLCSVRELNPDLVIVSELDGSENCASSGGFPGRFAVNLEMLWRFLDSTGAAFKGRDCAERKTMEGEAAQILDGPGIEGRERWREMMFGLGFREEGFGDESIETAKALLRKYDGNWEMKAERAVAAVRLRWKGQLVSFCSLWKPIRG